MKIMITGAGGQLGQSLQRALSLHEVEALTHADLDVSDGDAVAKAIKRVGPSLVINCAALTDTTLCERDPGLAHRINATGAANVARVCAQDDHLAILISTDEVFDGAKASPYREDDEPGPVNAYGASKLAGERLAGQMGGGSIVIRTSWLYGEGGDNFPSKLLAAARAGKQLRFVTNEVSAPTSTCDLAVAIRELIERGGAHGVYHLVSEGHASRFEWARADPRPRWLERSADRARHYAGVASRWLRGSEEA